MSGLEEIRDKIKKILDENIQGLHAYDTVPDAANVLPCVVVFPATTDFDVAMGRGTDTYEFDLLVLASYASAESGQDSLDAFVTGAGSRSIRQVVFNNRTLGLSDVDAHVAQMTEYGARYTVAEYNHIGARLRLVVHTRGTQ